MLMPAQTLPTARATAFTQPWRLPPQGLAVFHGDYHAPRLSHYFMPRLALEGKRILFLDGANCADPRLMARLAERRGMPFAQFNQQIMMARAFTCFQLTELISRVPQFLAQFPAEVVMVTAFPELYFDEDIRHADAQAAFQQALGDLRRWGQNETRNSKLETREQDAEFPVSSFQFRTAIENRQSKIDNGQHPAVSVALFSSASGFQPPAGRKLFFAQTCAAATELWKFQTDGQGRLGLTQQDKVLGTGDGELGKKPVALAFSSCSADPRFWGPRLLPCKNGESPRWAPALGLGSEHPKPQRGDPSQPRPTAGSGNLSRLAASPERAG